MKPGEYIKTDIQGPYVRDRHLNKYSQIFIDLTSWIKRFQNKTQAEEATEIFLKDAFIRSRNTIRVLKTDGDGIFGRSKTFQEMREREIHTRETRPI